ncbi:hypothetical protein QL285_048424 [Trifolium repens]|nr:hypothetical protein QL285_048424 [Trifolium repens]
MGLSSISPVQMQSPEEEGCSRKRKPEDYLVAIKPVYISEVDEEKDRLRHDKLMAELRKKYPIPSRKKPNCETDIDRSVATDMGPGDKPKKIRGKKKNERV